MLNFEFSPLSRVGQWYSSDMNEHPEIDSVKLEYHLRQNIVYYLILILFYPVLLLVSKSFAASLSGSGYQVVVLKSDVISNLIPRTLNFRYHIVPSSRPLSLHELIESSQTQKNTEIAVAAFYLSDKRAQFLFDVHTQLTTNVRDHGK